MEPGFVVPFIVVAVLAAIGVIGYVIDRTADQR